MPSLGLALVFLFYLISGIQAVVVGRLDYVRRDGRTKAFRRHRAALWILILASTLVGSIVAWLDSDEKEKLRKDLTTVRARSEQSLAEITGGDSFPYVYPQTHAATDTAVPLLVWNGGRHQLTGVTIRIQNGRDFIGNMGPLGAPPIDLGTLPPHWNKPLPREDWISPHPNDAGVDQYNVYMSAQSGSFHELLNFRRGKYALPWAFSYTVTREDFLDTETEIGDGGFKVPKGTIMPKIMAQQLEWSDDLGDGRPTTR